MARPEVTRNTGWGDWGGAEEFLGERERMRLSKGWGAPAAMT